MNKKIPLRDTHGPLVIRAPCTLSGDCYVHPASSCCEACDGAPLTVDLLEQMLEHQVS